MMQETTGQMNSDKIMIPPSSKPIMSANENHSIELSRKIPIKVALVEDNPKARASWTKFINSFSDFTCVCTCSSGEEAVRVIPSKQPDVVLMDLFLPRMSGIECTVRLKELLPQTQIIILTAMDDEELVFMALKAGADGYLLKRTEPSELRTALLDVLGGGAPMTSEIARRVIASFREKTPDRGEAIHLSLREEQILVLLSQGYSNKTIADKLGLSIDTVCGHLKRAFKKLHVSSRTEAVIRYMASNPSQPKPPA
jgi:DNA-binding NarL/FixJ family response regulator